LGASDYLASNEIKKQEVLIRHPDQRRLQGVIGCQPMLSIADGLQLLRSVAPRVEHDARPVSATPLAGVTRQRYAQIDSLATTVS
jgi:hypothetical protein